MPREISLDGVETSVIKGLGFAGGGISGKSLKERIADLEEAEIMSSLRGLMDLGYVISDAAGFNSVEEFEKANFHVNSGYMRDLKESLNPNLREKPKSRRIRRE